MSGGSRPQSTAISVWGVSLLLSLATVSGTARAEPGLTTGPLAERLSFFRFLEDYSDVTPEDRAHDWFAAIKSLPLGIPGVSLAVGADYRFRFEQFDNAFFGLSPAPDYDQRLNRFMLHADLRADSMFRAFVQLSAFIEDGRDPGPGPFDESDPDIQQAFIDVGAEPFRVRLGRQEIVLGSGKLSDIREGPNQRQSFDAVRTTLKLQGDSTIDGFFARDVVPSDEAFADSSADGTRFWGLYGTKLWSPWAKANVDAYYFGIDRENALYGEVTGWERRHSLGARLIGESGPLAYEYEAIHQFGELEELSINAWGLRTEHYYTLEGPSLRPKIGLIANVTSGDGKSGDGTLGTFDALFPNPSYTTEAAIFRPRNLYELHPVVAFDITPTFNVLFEANFLWRVDTADAVYAVPGFALVGGGESDARYVGSLFDVVATWKPSPFLAIQGSYVHAVAGAAILDVGGSDIDFFHAQAAVKF